MLRARDRSVSPNATALRSLDLQPHACRKRGDVGTSPRRFHPSARALSYWRTGRRVLGKVLGEITRRLEKPLVKPNSGQESAEIAPRRSPVRVRLAPSVKTPAHARIRRSPPYSIAAGRSTAVLPIPSAGGVRDLSAGSTNSGHWFDPRYRPLLVDGPKDRVKRGASPSSIRPRQLRCDTHLTHRPRQVRQSDDPMFATAWDAIKIVEHSSLHLPRRGLRRLPSDHLHLRDWASRANHRAVLGFRRMT